MSSREIYRCHHVRNTDVITLNKQKVLVNVGDPQENIVKQKIQNSIKASNVQLFLKGSIIRHSLGISVKTCT